MKSRRQFSIRIVMLSVPVALFLAGCAAQYTEPPLADTHPASAKAAAAPMPEHSGTLDLAKADPLTTPAAPATGHDEAMPSGHDHQTPAAPAAPADAAALYTCPMHPEVVSKEPGRCPKCNMKLVPKKKEDRHE